MKCLILVDWIGKVDSKIWGSIFLSLSFISGERRGRERKE